MKQNTSKDGDLITINLSRRWMHINDGPEKTSLTNRRNESHYENPKINLRNESEDQVDTSDFCMNPTGISLNFLHFSPPMNKSTVSTWGRRGVARATTRRLTSCRPSLRWTVARGPVLSCDWLYSWWTVIWLVKEPWCWREYRTYFML